MSYLSKNYRKTGKTKKRPAYRGGKHITTPIRRGAFRVNHVSHMRFEIQQYTSNGWKERAVACSQAFADAMMDRMELHYFREALK